MNDKKIEVYTPEELEKLLKGDQEDQPPTPSGDLPGLDEASSEAVTDLSTLKQKAALADEYLDALQRKQAEFDNYRKRTLREQEEMRQRAAQDLIVDLLDVADAFRRAIETARNQEDAALQSYAEGVELVEKKLWDVLSKRNVERIESLGVDFDPHRHDAIMQQESRDHREGEIIGVVKEGYMLGGKVLRPATVIVARKPEE